jgi:hypothetical protein
MKGRPGLRGNFLLRLLAGLVVTAVASAGIAVGQAQSSGYERTFPQPKATVDKALREMQAATAGRLPVLAGFATSPDHPLDRYQRGYYQAKFQVNATPSGGSIVRVSVQVTAWYADPISSKSGYQLLTSNGRLEADLLDQLSEQLAMEGPRGGASAPASKPADSAEPAISAPVPRLPEVNGKYSSSLAQSLENQEQAGRSAGQNKTTEDPNGLRAEAESLEEILRNQAHPKNLVAVKKSGTPVVASASLTAKTLFLASAHDEFEMLDFNPDWVHVRISGLSRGWIWRNNLEMPDSVPDADVPPPPTPAMAAAALFHVSREEIAPFPGDWEPLRGKRVKILSVEKTNEGEKDAGFRVRLEFAKSLLDKNYADLAQKPQELAGIVVIFDSSDGGMMAATLATLQQWKAGKLSDAALWHKCFFDPPETFGESGSAASQ